MRSDELQIIQNLTGINPTDIQLSDNGFWSRGYIIDQGRIVFKFKKSPGFSYQDEINALNFVNTLNLGVNLQRVRWIAPDDSYLGMYGVIGEPLVVASKNKPELNQLYDLDDIASQLSHALKILHSSHPAQAVTMSVQEEIDAWQTRILTPANWQALSEYLSSSELAIVADFVQNKLPNKLLALGEHLVPTHGDLYKNNILIDDAGKIGLIDFYRLQLSDEAADFMDISNDLLRDKILQAYSANETLQQKVRLRALVRPIYIFGAYVERHDNTMLESFVRRLRQLIALGYHET